LNGWYYISVWLHIIGAAFWIGGMLFLPLILLPGIKNNPDRTSILIAAGLKFRFFGYIVLAIMLVTGLLNIYFRGLPFTWKFFTNTHFGQLIILKFILFFFVILISLLHDLLANKKEFELMQGGDHAGFIFISRWTGRIILFISLLMAYLGVAISKGG
jgi:putative copper export protein